MRVAPPWLPYRVRKAWDHARVVRAIAGLERTRPLQAVSPEAAHADVHMLLCRRDVEIGVLALKSLLRFDDTSWAVTITDDGSLTAKQRGWIEHHVPGVSWLPRVDIGGSVAARLANRPRLAALYRSDYQPLRKLLHPVAFSRCAKVLVLDPDTAFTSRPERLIEWAHSSTHANLFLHDHQNEAQAVPQETLEAFDEIRQRIGLDVAWSMPYYFFNSGLLAYRPETCDLDLAERYLEWLETAPVRYTTGKPGLWFGAWTPEQTAYQIVFAAMTPRAEALGDQYRVGNRPGYTFNHFLWLQLVLPSSLAMLQSVIESLPRRN